MSGRTYARAQWPQRRRNIATSSGHYVPKRKLSMPTLIGSVSSWLREVDESVGNALAEESRLHVIGREARVGPPPPPVPPSATPLYGEPDV